MKLLYGPNNMTLNENEALKIHVCYFSSDNKKIECFAIFFVNKLKKLAVPVKQIN